MSAPADFSKGRIFPLILRYSIPASVSLLITAVYNIVDRIFVGNLCGAQSLAALSICFPLSYIMIAFGLMCSAGGSTLFTLLRGQNQIGDANRSFGCSFGLTVVFELLLTAFLLLFPGPLLKLFGVTQTTYASALEYYRIVALGCLFQGLTLVFCDYVRVSGKPMLGMCVSGIGAAANIALDAVFVAGFHWGVGGAAAATVIGQILSAVFGGFLLFGGKTLVRCSKKVMKMEWKMCRKILSCGFAFWIAQMAMGLIALIYNSRLGRFGGDEAIGVYAVVSSVMTFVIMPASGISQGIQPLIGFNYSAGRGSRVRETLFRASALSVGVTAVIWIAVEFFPRAILHAFGGNEQMMEIGVPALRLNFIVTPVLGFVMLATTFFQSIGKPAASTWITLLRQAVVLVPLIYLLPIWAGLQGIFLAQPVSDLLALVLCVLLIRREFCLLDGSAGRKGPAQTTKTDEKRQGNDLKSRDSMVK